MKKIFLILFLSFSLHSIAQPVAIIPKPVKMELKEGSFTIDRNTSLEFDSKLSTLRNTASFFSNFVNDVSGIRLHQHWKNGKKIFLRIRKEKVIGDEGYLLSVTPQSIVITANDPKGIFYGIQTLIQTLPKERTNAVLQIPSMEITDYPRFQWRGMHLDVARHFFTPNTIKMYIDLLSAYKFNTFHWHLSDDQGWRLEIKKYPKLTSVGAWRADRRGILWNQSQPTQPGEPVTYGGFYTQEQAREIVRYAAERNITIVPEFDVPGHSAAAITAYPFLSCSGKQQTMITGGIYPKDYESTLDVGKDSVYTFLENVLTEVMKIFPSKYIHIGGDEVDKSPWAKDSACQRLMRKENLKDLDELQSYFIRRMEKFLNAPGKKLIGWDEILEGGVAPEATVMSWRGESGGIAAAKQHHYVVMTPGEPLYFDHYQAGPEGEPLAFGGMNTLKMVYDYNPVPKELSPDEAKYILGAQANLWAEMIQSETHVEYMILPRMLALAETDWTPLPEKNYDDFYNRVQQKFREFDQEGLTYCEGNFNVTFVPGSRNGKLNVTLQSEIPGAQIYYTTDGSYPGAGSIWYNGSVNIDSSMKIRAVVVQNGIVKSKVPSQQSFVVDKVSGLNVNYQFPPSTQYMANGINSLTDGIRGTLAVNKYWHGFAGNDMIATIELPETETIHEVSAGFLQRYSDWIFLPQWMKVEVSDDGQNFHEAGKVKNDISPEEMQPLIKDFKIDFSSVPCRYIRVTAKNLGVCPPGHPGEGKPAWLFADEIVVY